MSFKETDIDLKLDPFNPPKFCPQCKRNGTNTRVKKYKVDPTKPNERTIMCKNKKCPWPFSVLSPDEAIVKNETINEGLTQEQQDKGNVSDAFQEKKIDKINRSSLFELESKLHFDSLSAEFGLPESLNEKDSIGQDPLSQLVPVGFGTDIKRYECPICQKGFQSKINVKDHINSHLGIKDYECGFCEQLFSRRSTLNTHIKYKHTKQKRFKCKDCDYKSVTLDHLKRHERIHTGERPHQCPYCTYAAAHNFGLKRHIRVHTGENPYTCEVCDAKFNQQNSLKTHVTNLHAGQGPKFKCEYCTKIYKSKVNLAIHIKKYHTSDKPLCCPNCSEAFKDKYTLKLHQMKHVAENSYKCSACSYSTSSKYGLSKHMVVHSKVKPFTCDLCEKSFKVKYQLQAHQKVHHNHDTNELLSLPKHRKHECLECEKTFTHIGFLRRHMKTHPLASSQNEEFTDCKKFTLHQPNIEPIVKIETEFVDSKEFTDCKKFTLYQPNIEPIVKIEGEFADSKEFKQLQPIICPTVKLEDVEFADSKEFTDYKEYKQSKLNIGPNVKIEDEDNAFNVLDHVGAVSSYLEFKMEDREIITAIKSVTIEDNDLINNLIDDVCEVSCSLQFKMEDQGKIFTKTMKSLSAKPIMDSMIKFTRSVARDLEDLEFRSKGIVLDGEELAGSVDNGIVNVRVKPSKNTGRSSDAQDEEVLAPIADESDNIEFEIGYVNF